MPSRVAREAGMIVLLLRRTHKLSELSYPYQLVRPYVRSLLGPFPAWSKPPRHCWRCLRSSFLTSLFMLYDRLPYCRNLKP